MTKATSRCSSALSRAIQRFQFVLRRRSRVARQPVKLEIYWPPFHSVWNILSEELLPLSCFFHWECSTHCQTESRRVVSSPFFFSFFFYETRFAIGRNYNWKQLGWTKNDWKEHYWKIKKRKRIRVLISNFIRGVFSSFDLLNSSRWNDFPPISALFTASKAVLCLSNYLQKNSNLRSTQPRNVENFDFQLSLCSHFRVLRFVLLQHLASGVSTVSVPRMHLSRLHTGSNSSANVRAARTKIINQSEAYL